ncbi:MAG: PQQ-binding-like beta-propeller repeat protein, partial [Opitutae bacterium]|nr:PQQ-binding-like beta-propeller repeat protein [Opitutae bacterium]
MNALSFAALRLAFLAILFVFVITDLSGDERVGQWRFDSTTLQEKTLKSTLGPWMGKVLGSASLTNEKPLALEASKEFRGIILSEDIQKANLPTKDISVTAWARVDKPIEWGGILGAIQDNGSFERGWLLGYVKNSFFFAISSESKKRLTYLKTTLPYSPGYWYHLTGTYDGKVQRIFMDGKLAAESKVQNGSILYPPKGRFALGAYLDENEPYPFEGRLEQVTLWNRSLEPKEIADLFIERKKLFPSIEAVASRNATEDWPTFLHDNEQSGKGAASIKGELSLRWTHHLRMPPKPAWPPPAKQDFWHKKYNLKPRVIFDRAFHIVGVGDRLYLASSADDQTRCLSLTDGKELWSHFAEAPIRLAPTVAGKKVLFGVDDGYVRCLNASDGKLLWKTR